MLSHVDPALERPRWGAIAVFVALAFSAAWLLAIPLWIGDGLASPMFAAVASAIMLTPALATIVIVAATKKDRRFPLGLSPRPVRRTILWSLGAALAFALATLASTPLNGLFGGAVADWVELSGYRATTGFVAPAHILILTHVAILGLGMLATALFTFGEELGWRGWLLPALMPLGRWPALIVCGVIWGLWHAPLILLGYNYARPDALGLLFMVIFCVLGGIVLGWLRLRTGTIWPAVFAHAAINTFGSGWLQLLTPAGADVDALTASFVGFPGWLVLLVLIVGLIVFEKFRAQPLPERRRSGFAASS